MTTLFTLAGLIVGALLGHKIGWSNGWDMHKENAFVVVSISDIHEIANKTSLKNNDTQTVVMDEKGWGLIDPYTMEKIEI